MAPPLSHGARRRSMPARRFIKPVGKFRSFGVEVNAGHSPDQPKFFFDSIIRIIKDWHNNRARDVCSLSLCQQTTGGSHE